MSKRIAFLKKFVADHKVAITVTVTSAVFIVLMMRNSKALNAFLEEHGLTEAYYAIEE